MSLPENLQPQRRPGRPQGGQRQQGRSALLRAARELMAEKGLPRVTVREVAERAGVGAALVNYYFGSKAGLLDAIVQQHAEDVRRRLHEAVSRPGSVEQRIGFFIQELVRSMHDNPYLPRLIVEQVLFADEAGTERYVREFARPNLALIQSLLEEGRAAGEIRELNPFFTLPSMIGACVFFFLSAPVLRRLFGIEEVTPELTQEFARSTAELILHGIVASGKS